MLTSKEASELFEYDPVDGVLYWKPLPERYPNGRIRAKAYRRRIAAGSFNHKRNFINVQYNGINYKAHRIIWLLVYGHYPEAHIDHVNGNGSDNRLENIRIATNAENNQNLTVRKDNTSGFQGVWFNKKRGKFSAELCVGKKRIRKYGFLTAEQAYDEYLRLKQEHHKFHPDAPRQRNNMTIMR